jgi:hypothetical protein
MCDTRSKEMNVNQTPSKGESEMHNCTCSDTQDDRFGLCPLCSNKGRLLTNTCSCGKDLCWMFCFDCQTKWVVDHQNNAWAELTSETESFLAPCTQVMPLYHDVPRGELPDDSYSLLLAIQHTLRTVALLEKNGRPTAKFVEQCVSLLDHWLEEALQREQEKRTINSRQQAQEALRRVNHWIENLCMDPSDDDLPS